MDLALVLAGFFVGGLVGVTSAGSGVIMAPILLALGIPPRIVVGSGLLYSFVTKLVGGIQHHRQETINRKWMARLVSGSLPGALLGMVLIHLISARLGVGAVDLFIKKALGLVLVVSATLLITAEIFATELRQWFGKRRFVDPDAHKWLVLGFSAVVGLAVGITSIGSGSLVALFLLAFARLEAKEIVGTNIAYSVVVSLLAALGHASMGNVDYSLVGWLLVGSVPGVILGSHLTTILPVKSLRVGTAVFVLLGGLRIVMQ
jgi:hypothetical protein